MVIILLPNSDVREDFRAKNNTKTDFPLAFCTKYVKMQEYIAGETELNRSFDY